MQSDNKSGLMLTTITLLYPEIYRNIVPWPHKDWIPVRNSASGEKTREGYENSAWVCVYTQIKSERIAVKHIKINETEFWTPGEQLQGERDD